VSNLDFENCLSVGMNHYEGAIFGGVPYAGLENFSIIQRGDEYVHILK